MRAFYRDWGLDGDLWVSAEHLWQLCSAIEQQLPKLGPIRIQTADDLLLVVHKLLAWIARQRNRMIERQREIETLRSCEEGASKQLAELRAEMAGARADEDTAIEDGGE